jgi:hypothetical protein
MVAAVETPLSDACTSTKTATAAKPTTATAEEASRASSAERASRGSGWVIPRCVERAVASEVTMIAAVAKRISVGEVRSLIHQPG